MCFHVSTATWTCVSRHTFSWRHVPMTDRDRRHQRQGRRGEDHRADEHRRRIRPARRHRRDARHGSAQQSDEVVERLPGRRTTRPRASTSSARRRARGSSAMVREGAQTAFDYVLVDTPGEDTSIIDPVVAACRSGDLADPAIKAGGRRRHREFRVRAADQRGAWASVPAWRAEDTHHRAPFVTRNSTARSARSSSTRRGPICSGPRSMSAMSTRTSTTGSGRSRCRR